jgi:maltose/moltooligosaccharide transporter
MFALYNGVAALGSLLLPRLVSKIGRREAHSLCLLFGTVGLLGFAFIADERWLWIPAVAIGLAWASILSIPYAMVSSAVPPERMGVFMGIHNVFLVLPQLVATALLGWIVDDIFGDHASLAIILAAVSFAIAAALTLTIPDRHRD